MDEWNEQIREVFEWYGNHKDRQNQEQIVEMLRELQEICGYLTPELQERAAQTAGVKPTMIQALIRMYPSLKAADYQHVITVCSGDRCGKKQGVEIISAVRKKLGVKKDGISADGKILLKVQNCLKQCKTSPNMLIDGKLYSGMTPENVSQLIDQVCQNKA